MMMYYRAVLVAYDLNRALLVGGYATSQAPTQGRLVARRLDFSFCRWLTRRCATNGRLRYAHGIVIEASVAAALLTVDAK